MAGDAPPPSEVNTVTIGAGGDLRDFNADQR